MPYIKELVMKGFKSFAKKTELPFTPGINIILGPNGSGKCIVGESKVSLANGEQKRIDEIVNSKLDKAVKTEDGYLIPGDGTKINSLNLKTLKIEKKEIKSYVKRTSPEELLSIKTRSGREITSTKYHPLFILKNGEVSEARADELKEGVRIAVPRKINFTPDTEYFEEIIDNITEGDNIYIPYNEEFRLILLSLKNNLPWKALAGKIGINPYVIKGLLDKQAIKLFYLIKILRKAEFNNKEIIKRINVFSSHGKKTKFDFKNSPEFSRFLGYILAEGKLTESNQIWFTNGTKEIVEDYVQLVKKLFNKTPLIREYKPNCWDVIFYSSGLITLLKKLGVNENAGNKEISNIYLKHSSDKEVSELLNGLYCGDGYISKSSIEITTKSKKLAEGIGTCLLRLGLTYKTKKVIKTIKSLNFSGEYYDVVCYGVYNFKKFNENISLIHKKKRQRVFNALNKKANSNLDLIQANNLVKSLVKEQKINVKLKKKEFPLLDSYCYNQCIPSRNGLQLLTNKLFLEKSMLLNKLITLSNSDIYWDEIKEIKEVKGRDWVYDLCIEENHNFISNNIVVHNSNVSDALCFVLGRLSIKSMRAAKASNLVFQGGKGIAPSKEAMVEIVFENSDRTFSVDSDELSIKRVVRKNGQSIYKINNQTKTRQEVLTILAQAGIDPNGFNIILQGEIQNFVKLQPEERRKVIEEVSGISVYESRKEKSLKELDKTEDKLKEVSAILKERNSYLNNLEKEREEALKAKKFKEDVKKLKKSILNTDLQKKKKEISSIEKEIKKRADSSEKNKKEIIKFNSIIKSLENKISEINKTIQESTGLEQEKLNNEIANLRAEIAGLNVKIENGSRKINTLQRQKKELEESTKNLDKEIKELQKESPTVKKIQKELELKKKALEKIEEERKKYYMSKSELKTISERIDEKKQTLQGNKNESEFLIKQIDSLSIEIFDKKASEKKLENLKLDLSEKKQFLENLNLKEKELEKAINMSEYEISEQNKIIDKISRMDICPLCKSHIDEKHISQINREVEPKLLQLNQKISSSEKSLNDIYNKRDLLKQDVDSLENQISKANSDIMKLRNIDEKSNQIKSLQEKIDGIKRELEHLEKRRKVLEQRFDDNMNIEEKYERLKIEVQEISLRNHENLDSEVSFKQREFERMKISYKQIIREEEELSEELVNLKKNLSEKEIELDKKRKQEEILTQKFQKLIGERDQHQYEIRKKDSELSKIKNVVYNIEQEVNNLKIDIARKKAEIESLETEILEFPDSEILKGSKEALTEKLSRTQERLDKLGSVNMRALEVYDRIKKEYDSIREKVETIEKEKEGVLRIIHEIDIKKKKVFLKTLEELNVIFSRNFSQISTKGEVYLDLENKKDPFSAGVNVVIKTGHGKYFDIKSLSGGEQTMVALSLIFAIQELKPYCFYILDEIDAALDKRNSERLANLLKRYMQKGQYIIISHNDEIITNATNLYGVSMHSGVSKVVSLRI